MKTILGMLFVRDGISVHRELVDGPTGPRLRTRGYSTPASEIRHRQAARIPLDISHDGVQFGEILDLQLRGDRVWCVAHADITPPPWLGELYFSPSWEANPDGSDLVINAVGIGTGTRALNVEPVTILDGRLSHRHCVGERWPRHQMTTLEADILTRAAHNHLDRQARGQHQPIIVDDVDQRIARERTLARQHGAELAQLSEDDAWRHRPLRHSAPHRAIIAVH